MESGGGRSARDERSVGVELSSEKVAWLDDLLCSSKEAVVTHSERGGKPLLFLLF